MDDIQPTARWANRMLRPLTSIYRRLERHHETLAIIAAESRIKDQSEDINTHGRGIAESVTAGDTLSGSDADEDDPVWIPGKKPEQRRIRHKYSGRGQRTGGRKRTRLSIHSPEALRTLPGAIELATPLITGKRWEIPSSARSQLSVERGKGTTEKGQQQPFRDRYSLHKSPWQTLLDQSDDSGFADIAHNLDRVFQNFLCNTRIGKHDQKGTSAKRERGARSLLSMVARSLPEFIASEQEAQYDMEQDGDENMCDAYFTELESFYAPHGRGWKPLREAVRAQGIYLVSTMIQNKWVTDPIACALIEKCGYHYLDACESLLSTFLSTRTKYSYPLALKPVTEPRIGDPVELLRKYTHYGQASRSFIFDELSKLLMRGVLPPEWMATKHWTGWVTRATIAFSKGDHDCAAASRLIEAVVFSASDIRPTAEASKPDRGLPAAKRHAVRGRATRASCEASTGKPDLPRSCPLPVEDALSNHITSLLAALCGMHISRSRDLEDVDALSGTKAGYIINCLSFTLEKDMASRPISHITNLTLHQLFRRGCVVLANCLLECNDAALASDRPCVVVPSPGLENHCKILASRADLMKELALFVRQAFRCFRSATDDERLYTAQEIRRIISQFPRLADVSSLSTLLSQVAIEAAMGFAEDTGEPDDHLWAVEIQETVLALQNGNESSSESTDETDEQEQRRGYRWEESIGEWVARTPTAKANPVPSVFIRRRTSTATIQMPCIPCSTDSSSPESDEFEEAASSLTSSPSSVGTVGKRNFDELDSSPLRPIKRRSAREDMIENTEDRRCESRSSSLDLRSPSLEPVPRHRRILREMSNYNTNSRAGPVITKPASKVEIVIFNKTRARVSEEPAQTSLEPDEKEVHRAVERQRPRRPRTSQLSTVAVRPVPQRRSIIPCSDDSDDELSFL